MPRPDVLRAKRELQLPWPRDGDEISSVFVTDFELVYKFDAASLMH